MSICFQKTIQHCKKANMENIYTVNTFKVKYTYILFQIEE